MIERMTIQIRGDDRFLMDEVEAFLRARGYLVAVETHSRDGREIVFVQDKPACTEVEKNRSTM